MNTLRIVTVALAVALSASAAWAQFGLYGSPETLNLAPAQPTAVYGGYVPAPTYPVMPAATAAQGVPAAPAYAGYGAYAGRPMAQTAAVDPAMRMPAEPAPPVAPYLTNNVPAPMPGGSGPSMVSQMLEQGDAVGAPAYDAPQGGASVNNNAGGELRRAVDRYEQAACESCTGCMDCAPVCAVAPWYVQASVLTLTRNKPNRLWTSHQSPPPITNEANQLMNTQDIDLPWSWGGEIRFGRHFCCGQWAVEATYWSIEPMDGMETAWNASGVSTPLVVGNVLFAGNPGTAYFDHAFQHRLWRYDEFQNIELDLVHSPMGYAIGAPWSVDWSVGVRYFRFDDRLIFGACAGGYIWGQDPTQEAYLNEKITNHMVGFQIGCRTDYHLAPTLRLFAAPKVGIYNNHMENYFQAYLGDGTIATPDPSSGQTGTYPVSSSSDALSFLTEIDVGVEWQFARNWSAQIGYRVLAATSVGLADNQIPPYIVDIPEIADIDKNGDLVLHGAFAGLTLTF